MTGSVRLPPAPPPPAPGPPPSDVSAGGETLRTLLSAGALLTFAAAALVIVFGVIATSGVYGSRLAWLVAVALPLLATTMLLSWLATRAAPRARRGPASSPGKGVDLRKLLFVAALALVGIPVALAVALLSVYALIFVVHGISLLL